MSLVSLFGSSLDASSYAASFNYTTNYTCPTDNTAGGINGPSIGQLVATVNLDANFYSWAGCNCSSGSDSRVYSIASNGEILIEADEISLFEPS